MFVLEERVLFSSIPLKLYGVNGTTTNKSPTIQDFVTTSVNTAWTISTTRMTWRSIYQTRNYMMVRFVILAPIVMPARLTTRVDSVNTMRVIVARSKDEGPISQIGVDI
ncbi:hypothetical protein TWF225_004358 [Orbilia oligospora]|uniref:Uncharacterized protein n=1 Tax=Orbilia oligospora TaxID=2813651 RepID=A0A7C8PWE3_ORBOL|nr:hypothetical protein TWF751_007242 [Orbilia oligospora]KAF3187203.1 hypothetical protein TWF225_004358 [Orbilia oligospora]KAF3260001.1 hypothetical protein TWF217_005027 [Orbilia oligospora]KAF3267084.1 hypothetical protein TWF128_010040 [Orbilia oligospora]KAF3293418.1 hypothetical protein TWF132_004737 [Orbilia oligospora]